ncbi:MAG: hypothetical protein KGH78_00745 [Candidatus Micrarchaeota archaeon]|nr:hypothetical protein [Candidatus Micrarchaeota archaeon]
MEIAQKIVPVGKDVLFLDAISIARDNKGRLPHNSELDNLLMLNRDSQHAEPLAQKSFWTDSWLVYPSSSSVKKTYGKEGGSFKKGEDVVDEYRGKGERKWIFPCSCMPSEAIGTEGVGLYFESPKIEVSEKAVTISIDQSKVVVLHNFLQNEGFGIIRDRTGIPLGATESELSRASPLQLRFLSRNLWAGVKPIVRSSMVSWTNFGDARNIVIANGRTEDITMGVAYVQGA